MPTNLPTPASGHVICHIKRLAQTASSLHAEGICSYVLSCCRIQRDQLPFLFFFSSPSFSSLRLRARRSFPRLSHSYVNLFLSVVPSIVLFPKFSFLRTNITRYTNMQRYLRVLFLKYLFVLKFSDYVTRDMLFCYEMFITILFFWNAWSI